MGMVDMNIRDCRHRTYWQITGNTFPIIWSQLVNQGSEVIILQEKVRLKMMILNDTMVKQGLPAVN